MSSPRSFNKYVFYDQKNFFWRMNIYSLDKKDISQMRYIFFKFFVKKAFSLKKKKSQYKFFFHIKLFFSANNVYFVKNTNIFSKKIFFFNLALQQMNNHTLQCCKP